MWICTWIFSHTPKIFSYIFSSFHFRDILSCICVSFVGFWDASHFYVYIRWTHINTKFLKHFLDAHTHNALLLSILYKHTRSVHVMWWFCEASKSSALKWMCTRANLFISATRIFVLTNGQCVCCVCVLARLTCFYIMSYLISYEMEFFKYTEKFKGVCHTWLDNRHRKIELNFFLTWFWNYQMIFKFFLNLLHFI